MTSSSSPSSVLKSKLNSKSPRQNINSLPHINDNEKNTDIEMTEAENHNDRNYDNAKNDNEEDDRDNDNQIIPPPPSTSSPLSLASPSTSTSPVPLPGIIYLSRVPPFMQPDRIRSILGDFGSILRVYLRPEKDENFRLRKKSGGSTRKKFVDGWVEYQDKRIAKRVAIMLNNKNIGGRKRGYYYDDIWNLKYLSGFQWSDITEEEAIKRRTTRDNIQMEKRTADKEAENIREKWKKSKEIQKIKERKGNKMGSNDLDINETKDTVENQNENQNSKVKSSGKRKQNPIENENPKSEGKIHQNDREREDQRFSLKKIKIHEREQQNHQNHQKQNHKISSSSSSSSSSPTPTEKKFFHQRPIIQRQTR